MRSTSKISWILSGALALSLSFNLACENKKGETAEAHGAHEHGEHAHGDHAHGDHAHGEKGAAAHGDHAHGDHAHGEKAEHAKCDCGACGKDGKKDGESCAHAEGKACDCGKDGKKGAHAHGDHAHGGHGHDHGHHHGSKAPDPNGIPADQAGSGTTKNGTFFVSFTPEANPIPFQKTFALSVKVFDGKDTKKPAESVKLDSVRALMPAHDHGMKVEPTIKQVGPGEFKVEGMRFHMQGAGDDGKWVLELALNDGKAVDLFTHDLQCCR